MDIEQIIEQRKMEKNKVRSIIVNRDADTLIVSEDDVAEQVFAALVYDKFEHIGLSALNGIQRTIYLCKTLTDRLGVEGLLSVVSDEDIFFRLPESCKALSDIGADRTADVIGRYIELFPAGCFEGKKRPDPDWLMKDEKRRISVQNLDSTASARPDGDLTPLYKKYLLISGSAGLLFENTDQ